MTWPIPEYSRNRVDRAGQTLCNSSANSKAYKEAMKILNNWRSSHGYPMNTFQSTLRAKLKKIDRKAIVVQRLKRAPSIINKLQRFDQMKLSRMQDIGGLRAVVNTVDHAYTLKENYEKSHFQHRLVKLRDYISEPKDSGYRSIHLIYRYQSRRHPEYNGLLLEIQIRTNAQHAWATAVETMGVFLKYSLKSSEGPEKWLNFFSLTGSAFALLERCPPIKQYSNLTELDTFRKVIEMAKQLNVYAQLRGFSIATDAITREEKTTGNYHLIILEPEKKRVRIKTYGLNRLDDANRDYSKEELRIGAGENIQVVLVSANSIKALKKAYPNFFLNTNSFLGYISYIKQQVKQLERD